MDNTDDLYIPDIGSSMAKVLDSFFISSEHLTEIFTKVLIKTIDKFIEQLEEFSERLNEFLSDSSKIMEKSNFQMINTIAPVASEISVEDVSPRSPPIQSFKEKIEIKFLYYRVNYEERIYSMCEKILENEFYTFARAIFIYLLRLFFWFLDV